MDSSQWDWVYHPRAFTLRQPLAHRKSDSDLDPSRRSSGAIDPFQGTMPTVPLPDLPAPHPLAEKYFPSIPPNRPRPKTSTKPRLAEILLPHPPLRTSHSLPLLKPPPTPPDEGQDGKPTRFRKMKRIGSGLLVKVGLKEDEEWEVVPSSAEIPGPKQEVLKEERQSIPWPPSPHVQRRVSSTFGSPRPLSFPSFSSFLMTSAGNRDSQNFAEMSKSGSGSSNDHARGHGQVGQAPARKESGESAMDSYLSSFPYPPTPYVGMFEHQQATVDPPIPAGHPFSGSARQTTKHSQTAGVAGAGTGTGTGTGGWWGQMTPTDIPGLPPTPPSSRTPRIPLSPLSHKNRRPSSQHSPRTQSPQSPTALRPHQCQRQRHFSQPLPMPLTPPHSLAPVPSTPELLSLLSTLLLLRDILYAHAASSQRLLDGYVDELPGFVYRDLERQIDRWWETWRGVLNDYGARTSSLILSLPTPPSPPHSPSPLSLPTNIPTKPIPPALTPDSLQKTIWTLEEAGQIPSFTFARMFGRGPGVRVRRMEDDEVREAGMKGWREWQDGEWGVLQREGWKEFGAGGGIGMGVGGFGRRGRQQARKSSVL
ncbi:hypothetical protein IAR50_004465 [Cryptococcus sp. DSM 104548]